MDTDPATITSGSIYPYVKDMRVYRCPADRSLVLGTSIPILRTYSLSCFMGGPPQDTTDYGIKPLTQTSQIRTPSKLLTFLEEDDATIDDGHFLYSPLVNNWYNIPSWLHQNGVTLAFADGHQEYWRWQSARPTTTYFSSGSALTDPRALQDVARMQQTAPASQIDCGRIQFPWPGGASVLASRIQPKPSNCSSVASPHQKRTSFYFLFAFSASWRFNIRS